MSWLKFLLPSSVVFIDGKPEGVGVDVGAEVQESKADEEIGASDTGNVGSGCPELKLPPDGPIDQVSEDARSEAAESVGRAEP
jgi:hypothetical protein